MSTTRITSPFTEGKISKAQDRKSRTTSCERCKKRKQKCDHRLPTCTNCLRANAVCVQPEKYIQHVPLKDSYTLHLEEKVAKLEAKLKVCMDTEAHRSIHNPQSNNSAIGLPFLDNPAQPSPGNLSTISSSGTDRSPSSLNPLQSTTVSILNVDPSSGVEVPQSFSVVSSLLQESFWERAASISGEPNTCVRVDNTLLPSYDFEIYLKYPPIDHPDDKLGAQFLTAFFSKFHLRFAVLDMASIHNIFEKRAHKPTNLDDPMYRFNSFFLYCVYALSSMLLKSSGKLKDVEPLRYYGTALRHAKLCKTSDPILQIKALVLTCSVQMRSDLDNGTHLHMINRASKLCLDNGLNRAESSKDFTGFDKEQRKRLFWSVYSLERLLSLSTGRQLIIKESEISLDLPTVLEKDTEGNEYIDSKFNGECGPQIDAKTALSFLCRQIQIKRIESDITASIYRVDKSLEEQFPLVQSFLERLDTWKSEGQTFEAAERDIFTLSYAKAVRLLIQPFLGRLEPNSELFRTCMRETGQISQIFKSFYQNSVSGFTTVSLHTIFVAGLTLTYGLWLAKETNFLYILEGIRNCTAVLFLLTERTDISRKHRDTFESHVTATIRHIIEHSSSSTLNSRISISTDYSEQQYNNESGNSNAISTQSSSPIAEIQLHQLQPLPSQSQSQSQLQQLIPVRSLQTAPQQLQSREQSQGVSHPVEISQCVPLPSTRPFTPIVKSSSSSPGIPATLSITDDGSVRSFQNNILPNPMANSGPGYSEIPGDLNGPSQNASSNMTGFELFGMSNASYNKAWLENYGYDDGVYNMIQDLSSWTKQLGDLNDQAGAPDDTWAHFADYGLLS